MRLVNDESKLEKLRKDRIYNLRKVYFRHNAKSGFNQLKSAASKVDWGYYNL